MINEVFLDGRLLAQGCDWLTLDAARFLNVVTNEFIEDNMHEHQKERDKMRAIVMQSYNSNYTTLNQMSGSSNDNAGVPYEEYETRDPLPSTKFIIPTDEGYPGLEPPLG